MMLDLKEIYTDEARRAEIREAFKFETVRQVKY